MRRLIASLLVAIAVPASATSISVQGFRYNVEDILLHSDDTFDGNGVFEWGMNFPDPSGGVYPAGAPSSTDGQSFGWIWQARTCPASKVTGPCYSVGMSFISDTPLPIGGPVPNGTYEGLFNFNGSITGEYTWLIYTGTQSRVKLTIDNSVESFGRFQISAVATPTPEPATWAMMIGGLGVIGCAMRRHRAAIAYT